MPLSFSTITIGVSRPPAFSSASKLTPPVIAPSPTTATTRASRLVALARDAELARLRIASLMPTA